MIVKFRSIRSPFSFNSFDRLKTCNFVIDIYRDCETSVRSLKKAFRSDKSRLCLTSYHVDELATLRNVGNIIRKLLDNRDGECAFRGLDK